MVTRVVEVAMAIMIMEVHQYLTTSTLTMEVLEVVIITMKTAPKVTLYKGAIRA